MIGIIGGTGLYSMEGLEVHETQTPDTPFGAPSAPVVIGTLAGQEVAFLPRHGANHELIPSQIPYRANIWALKSVGVRRVIGVSATGSLREEIEPGDLAIPTQYFDWTRGKRASSFFGDGIVAHVSTAEPACPALAERIEQVAEGLGTKLHAGKAYACVEGPRLGTRTESFFLRNAGCDLVGMTNIPEAFLAREAQLCYCTVAIATDYDCWLDDPEQHASVDKILPLYKQNLGRVQAMLNALLSGDEDEWGPCGCRESLKYAVVTPDSAVPQERQYILDFLRQ